MEMPYYTPEQPFNHTHFTNPFEQSPYTSSYTSTSTSESPAPSPFHIHTYDPPTPSSSAACPPALQSIPEVSPTLSPPAIQPQEVVPASPSPPTTDLPAPLKPPSCPQCISSRHNFTSYFHNTRIFTSPPHSILHLIERSYILRSKLETLLVSYDVRRIEEGEKPVPETAEKLIGNWKAQVEELARCVGERVGDEERMLVVESLEKVGIWTGEMVGRLMERVRDAGAGVVGPRMRRSECKALLVEFRRLWESVWILMSRSCSVDRREERCLRL